ncbi:hypothetical protein Cgig2_033506 [Carnegiea gigantea]|uniref:SH3 domain-containing protein n=1 Tax=Carnegiea gigantea TaxID=171969 RepID=A0A9Q1JXD1_9CARY|nr:hypothetical protein Cgig2_033506 [Carnegiea gigantea]
MRLEEAISAAIFVILKGRVITGFEPTNRSFADCLSHLANPIGPWPLYSPQSHGLGTWDRGKVPLAVLVNAERSFHRNVLTVLDKLHAQMMRMEQSNISCSSPDAMKSHLNTPETKGNTGLNGNKRHRENKDRTCFVAKVVIPFDAEVEGELSLSVDDTVVVQQVAPGGWSKGESNGKTGWFPSPYVRKLEEDPKDKMTSPKQ